VGLGSLPGELVALGFVGLASTVYLTMNPTTLQLICEPRFRGRVMALWSVTFLGRTPIGGPIVGVVYQHLGPRAGLFLGAGACFAAVVIGLLALPRVPANQRLLQRPALPPVALLTESEPA
jgi:MFS family permease